MTRFLLAGGGTAGHVNPMLALAQNLREQGHYVIALGTKEGLEARLVPERGFELFYISRLPLPRRLSVKALAYPLRFLRAVFAVNKIVKTQKIDAVVGFGGYASAPAYVSAFLKRKPLIIHEANAIAGFANRLGARFTKNVAVAFENSNLRNAQLTGMPIRQEIMDSVHSYDKGQARIELGLDPMMPTLLVTGGSLGAKRINETIAHSLERLIAAGIQVLHIVGERANLGEYSEAGYTRMAYCSRMDAAIAAADFAVSRAGASTVSEFSAAGLPAVYIPYPVGNGEQRLNAQTVVAAGGGLICLDKDFTPEFVLSELIPLISHAKTLNKMQAAAMSVGISDATLRLSVLVLEAVDTYSRD